MKDYKKYIDLNDTNNLVQQLLNLDCEMMNGIQNKKNFYLTTRN